ncbi:MAG: hypothetical protein FH749_01400 [Firmicutes bacterium]|nr:hypothetical protein [Bacillota bacterium]
MDNSFRQEIEAFKAWKQRRWVKISETEYKRAKELIPPEEFASKFKINDDGDEFYRLEEDGSGAVDDAEVALWVSLKQNQRLKNIEHSLAIIKNIIIALLVIYIIMSFIGCVAFFTV